MTTQTLHTGNNPDTIAVQGPVPTALTSPSSPRSRRFRRVRRAVATAAVSAVALTAFGVTWQIRADDDAPAVVPQRATEADLRLAAEWARRMEIPARVVHRPAAGRRVGPSSRDPQHRVSAGDLGRPLTSARSPPPVHAAGRGSFRSALQSSDWPPTTYPRPITASPTQQLHNLTALHTLCVCVGLPLKITTSAAVTDRALRTCGSVPAPCLPICVRRRNREARSSPHPLRTTVRGRPGAFADEYIGEGRILHTDEVGGSSPLPPTTGTVTGESPDEGPAPFTYYGSCA